MRPNPHQFTAFAYVAREGSFSRAAKRLGVTQSAVTQHVRRLERTIGAQLLLRNRDGVELTQTGQEFFELADKMVTLDQLICEKVTGYSKLAQGHLSIIANAPMPALGLIARFGALHPDVRLDFALYDWTSAMALLRNRRVDVGLVTDPVRSDELYCHTIGRARYVAYVPLSHPLANAASISLKDLLKETVLLPERGALTQRVVTQKLTELGLSLERTIKATTFPVMKEAILQGVGVGIFLEGNTGPPNLVASVPIREFQHQHEICLVIPKDKRSLRLTQSFATLALDAF